MSAQPTAPGGCQHQSSAQMPHQWRWMQQSVGPASSLWDCATLGTSLRVCSRAVQCIPQAMVCQRPPLSRSSRGAPAPILPTPSTGPSPRSFHKVGKCVGMVHRDQHECLFSRCWWGGGIFLPGLSRTWDQREQRIKAQREPMDQIIIMIVKIYAAPYASSGSPK